MTAAGALGAPEATIVSGLGLPSKPRQSVLSQSKDEARGPVGKKPKKKIKPTITMYHCCLAVRHHVTTRRRRLGSLNHHALPVSLTSPDEEKNSADQGYGKDCATCADPSPRPRR